MQTGQVRWPLDDRSARCCPDAYGVLDLFDRQYAMGTGHEIGRNLDFLICFIIQCPTLTLDHLKAIDFQQGVSVT
jgi:hypothetical protein